MKHLPPTLREDKRYLRFQIHSEEEITFSNVVEAFWKTTLGFLGEKEASEANPWIIKNQFNKEKQQGVIKVKSEKENDLRAALTMITDIDGKKAFLSVQEVSGTLKSLEGVED